MDKNAIKNFAIWARNKLIADSVYIASLLGISEKGIVDPLPQSTADVQLFDIGMKEPYAIIGQEIRQRKKLVEAIKNKERDLKYQDAFRNVMEEVAYTWFNRLIAIRFMEVNDYLPSNIRVLSSEHPAKTEPDLVTTPFDSDLSFSEKEKQQIIDWKNENKIDDVFRMLFIKQCNALNEPLPMLFEKISDYTELLLNVSVTDHEGIVWHLVHDIPEDNFNVSAIGDDGQPVGQVEIIGWLYQYYNTEPKDQVFANLKKNIKITKETIPAATQLFTPDWIVRYMVENSLGRLWVEGHPNDELKSKWKYYLDEAKQEEDVQKQLDKIYSEHAKLKPEDITCMDPCCGSGHILVYMFDVLMQIYQSQGYPAREAVASIVEHNIYGLDIDKRAAQLAYFAVMMKARQYDRRFLTREIQPHVFPIMEGNAFDTNMISFFTDGRKELESAMNTLISDLRDAREYGSILNVTPVDFAVLYERLDEIENRNPEIYTYQVLDTLLPFIQTAEMMAQKYDVVCTNPPYMGSDNMSPKLDEYARKHYPYSRYDLYAIFMERCLLMTQPNSYLGMITQHSWMYLQSYQNFRDRLLTNDIVNMAHIGAHGFEDINGEVVQTTTFIIRKIDIPKYVAIYLRLNNIDNPEDKINGFFNNDNKYYSAKEKYKDLPGNNIGYWVPGPMISAFEYGKTIENIAQPRQGLASGNNNRFYRTWQEIDYSKLILNASSKEEVWKRKKKYVPVNKGGGYCKWYGNNYEVIKFDENNYNKLLSMGNHLPSRDKYFLPGVTWGKIASSGFSCRFSPNGFVFTDSGMKITGDEKQLKYICGFLQSVIAPCFLKVFSETIHFETGNIARLPVFETEKFDEIVSAVEKNIDLAKTDWDSFEISWDFKKHPFIYNTEIIKIAYDNWKSECLERIYNVKSNDEYINQLFIDIYGLQNVLTPEEKDEDITVHKADVERDIRSFISYAVGCMFGRYSLDVDGLVYAGGVWDSSKYKTFIPDVDNVIPITDEEYLDDDIVGRFVKFIKVVYGEKTLEENLTFIANALGGKGKSSREVIRNYFLKDFFKDHCKTYQKRPIYWLYDSGKQNGFKALVYLHRMDENTTGKVRADYLHHMEQIYANEVSRMQDVIDHSKSAHEVSVAEKRMDKLKKQIKECQDYDAKLGHLALDQIKLNLDDGVKVNYRKAQTGRDGKFYEVLADSKNIMANDALWKEYLTEWPHEDE